MDIPYLLEGTSLLQRFLLLQRFRLLTVLFAGGLSSL
jgi:hypothetical protein